VSRTLDESTAETRKTLRVTPRCGGDGGLNAHETGEEINTNNTSIHTHTHARGRARNNMAISHNMFVSSNEPPPQQQPSTHALSDYGHRLYTKKYNVHIFIHTCGWVLYMIIIVIIIIVIYPQWVPPCLYISTRTHTQTTA